MTDMKTTILVAVAVSKNGGNCNWFDLHGKKYLFCSGCGKSD